MSALRAGDEAASAGRRRSRPWRDNIEALTLALTVAVLFKYFLVEAYKIPSGSMQPTLMGQSDGRGGGLFDRVLVDKLSYRWRDPERWEVAVFRYPLDRSRVFVKRIVGLPGDELRILGGDLWRREEGRWKVLRKPLGVQESTWLEVPSADRWSLSLNYDSWSLEGDRIVAGGAGEALFPGDSPSITDHGAHGYAHEILEAYGHPRRLGGQHDVGDLKLETVVILEADCERLVLEIHEGGARHRVELEGPAGRPDRPLALTSGGRGRSARSSAPFQLLAGEPHYVRLQNLDDRVEVWFDGEPVAQLDVPSAPSGGTGLRLATVGGGATFEKIRVWRDIHYRTDAAVRTRWIIPEGQYVVLGDNTLDSADSREWERTSIHVLDGPGKGEEFSGVAQEDVNPVQMQDGEFSDQVLFRDEWGERRMFRATRAHSSREKASFVPREMIQGRALAVFWPIDLRRGIQRLRWVR